MQFESERDKNKISALQLISKIFLCSSMNPFSFVVVSDLIYLSLKVNIGNRKILFSEYFCP